MKKFISVLLSLLMAFSLYLSVSADDTSEVPLEVPSEEPSTIENGESNENQSGEPNSSADDESIKEEPTMILNGAQTIKIAKVGDIEYESLKEAIVAANDGDTVTLISDVQ